MNITRETDYAIRCIYSLSTHPSEILMIEEIAEEMLVPRSFLAKIVQKLQKAGLVASFRGVKGGFSLSRSPGKINLYDVILAIQGPVVFNTCADNAKACDLRSSCGVHPVWAELRRVVEKRLRTWSFQKLIHRQNSPGGAPLVAAARSSAKVATSSKGKPRVKKIR